MDVSDPGGSIERPQDVCAGGPPFSAKMEAKGKPLKARPQGRNPARRLNGPQLVGGNAPHLRPLRDHEDFDLLCLKGGINTERWQL